MSKCHYFLNFGKLFEKFVNFGKLVEKFVNNWKILKISRSKLAFLGYFLLFLPCIPTKNLILSHSPPYFYLSKYTPMLSWTFILVFIVSTISYNCHITTLSGLSGVILQFSDWHTTIHHTLVTLSHVPHTSHSNSYHVLDQCES